MAAWIQSERKRLGLSTKQLADRLALIGVKVGEQTISVWESYAGRNPSPDNIDALERIYGTQSPDTKKDGDDSAVAAAIREQTLMLERLLTPLLEELRARSIPSPGAAAATQELADRLLAPRPDPDPVSTGRP